MKQINNRLFSLITVIGITSLAWGETVDAMRLREAQATKIGADTKIIIDGNLGEPAWETGKWQTNFIQRNPNDGSPETYQTEFCILYDKEYLYIGVKAHDPEPDKISAILSRRDDYTESDWMYVSIDSYNDNRTAFEFGLNAAGVKHDIRRYDDNNMDENWDAIWDGNAEINHQGWSAEWRIPFRELRFTSTDEMEWGLEVYRELPRFDNELSVWSYWSQSDEGFVSQYGSLKGLQGIKAQRPLYIIPYVASQTDISDNLVTPIHEKNYDSFFNLGGDVRYSSPFGLTLNASLNPDFGQVEADPADYNLTEFETYFAEKRPFFMEGANILRFPLGFGDGDLQSNSLFYSRRIGRAPQGYATDDTSKNTVTVEEPDVVHILGAAKITGKTPGGLSIGIMEAITAEEQAKVYYDDNSKDENVIEPLTNYLLTRFQQDFNNGLTSVGGILTAVNRNLDGTGIDYLRSDAYTGGIDIDHEFMDRQYAIQGAVAFSHIRGDTTAIQYAQLSSSRYYQRVDAKHLEYDPKLSSLSGYSVKGILSKNSGHIHGALGGVAYSPGLEINDLGFLRGVDNTNQFVWIQYYEWEPGKLLRNYRLNFNQWSNWNFAGERINLGGNINMHFTFHNSWRFGYGINRNLGGLNASFNRGGPMLYTPKGLSVWGYLDTDQRKDLFFSFFGSYFHNDDNVYSWDVYPGVTWRPRQNMQLRAEVGYNQLDDTWAWIGADTDSLDNTHYIWSGLQQKTLTLTLRAELTLSTNLSIQYYAEPFFRAGKFFDFMEIDDARNEDFDQRFKAFDDDEISIETDEDGDYYYSISRNEPGAIPYTVYGYNDFNYKQFRSNLVLRWEYSTGSVLYLVWSQGYTNSELFKPFNFNTDRKTLFNDVGNNVLMLKLSYIFNI